MTHVDEKLEVPFKQHRGFSRIFRPGALTLGFILPVKGYPDTPSPSMVDHASLTSLADSLGFAALWARDVPLFDPYFGDAGQMFDPFTYLGFLAGHTQHIALATGSAILPLRHPIHLAKQANTVDQLSGGRMVLGISSGDRPVEYPAFGIADDFETRGERFREAFAMFKTLTETGYPAGQFPRFGSLRGATDLLPPPTQLAIPAIVTGRSRQSMDWIAEKADGWLYYYVDIDHIGTIVRTWQESLANVGLGHIFKPFAQGLFLDLDANPGCKPTAIHAGLRIGRNELVNYLYQLQSLGVNHAPFNLKPSRRPADEVLIELSQFVLPHFPSHA